MKQGLVFIVLLFASLVAQATEEAYEFDTPQQRLLFQTLTAELRCPMCQNQNIADSDAMISHDMRRKVYTLIKQGKNEAEIIDYMKSRYGDFIHYKPPVTPVTMWLWLAPILFSIVALLVVFLRRRTTPPEDMAAKLAKAEAMLEQDK